MTTNEDRKAYDAKTRLKILGRDECPFCDMNAQANHTVWKGKYWYILRNLYLYSGDEKHLMVVPYAHKISATNLTSDEIAEFAEVYQFMKGFYGESQYFSCTRETMGNRSVEHYHTHYLPGHLQ
jgi:diadenosine tetraphosphate (Ap4A) HIT family hydrolase